jgi:hypothetical protein
LQKLKAGDPQDPIRLHRENAPRVFVPVIGQPGVPMRLQPLVANERNGRVRDDGFDRRHFCRTDLAAANRDRQKEQSHDSHSRTFDQTRTTINPVPGPHSTIHPTAIHPTAIHPTAIHPTAIHPTAIHPTAIHPTAIHPTAIHPTAIHPTAIHPTAIHPTAIHPTRIL